MAKNDPMAPSQRATILQIVRNKNNLEELMLKRRKEDYRRTMAIRVGDLEQERLDVFDFIKQLRLCESDTMEEFEKVRENLHKNPPTVSEDGPVILPLINTQVTSASQEHARRNGAFAIDTRTLHTAPAASLWRDPTLISLKDVSAKSTNVVEKKADSQVIPDKCLQRLAATGWMDAVLQIEARKKEKQDHLGRQDHQLIEMVKEAQQEDQTEAGGEEEEAVKEQEEVDKKPQRAARPLELPPSGNMAKVRSELALPAAVEEDILREQNKLRPSTTEKLRKKEAEVLQNPKPTPVEPREEDKPQCSLPRITPGNIISQQAMGSGEIQGVVREKKPRAKQRKEHDANEVLRLVLDRKAQKIGKKRKRLAPIDTRMKDFFSRVEDIVETEEPPNDRVHFLPPINQKSSFFKARGS